MAEVFTQADVKQIEQEGLDVQEIKRQLALFKRGAPYPKLKRPCRIGDGIRQLSPGELTDLVRVFEEESAKGRVMKFVPASGAASRMFKNLMGIYYSTTRFDDLNTIIGQGSDPEIQKFFNKLDRFPFFEELKKKLAAQGVDISKTLKEGNFFLILEYLLTEKGLNYSRKSKALLPFHRYPTWIRTSLEEHLVEGLHYVSDRKGHCRIHFTVSAEHQNEIHAFVEGKKEVYEKGGTFLDIQLSVQKSSTKTLAVDLEDRPLRDESGRLNFQPGGHGALLENLNNLKGDIVFIKNIDNVTTDSRRGETYLYKKALGGLLIRLQNEIFGILREFEEKKLTNDRWNEISSFASKELNIFLPRDFKDISPAGKKDFLFHSLDRPLRVCGMVKNRGEVGGGPHWVEQEDDSITCQIVETAQVDLSDPLQEAISGSSTHFNPVDLVCGVRDYAGRPFDLNKFSDPNLVFISKKHHQGRPLKALERPGLWNGGMAFWNTVFVEVPSSTFTPVKTVNDLLRDEHQGA